MIGGIIYWGTALFLFAAKATGMFSMSWFWATFLLFAPFYLIGFLIMAALVVAGFLEIKEFIEEKRAKDETVRS